MGILGWIFVVLLAIVGAILWLASRKPDEFTVSRKAVIPASPEAVFAEINDLARWQAWSPWAKKDPNATFRFSENTAGPGASLAWAGNGQVGTGRMTIAESRPGECVSYRLEFEKPFKARNMASFDLRPAPGGTEVVWSMRGPAPLLSRVMDLLMNMDRMIGRDFEQGLANLAERLGGKAG
jgi:hypothetical protein